MQLNQQQDHADKNGRHGSNGTHFGAWYHTILRLWQIVAGYLIDIVNALAWIF